jgi:hypothetical protein
MELSELEARARRAYEGGRWKKGLRSAMWAVPAMALSLAVWGPRMCFRVGPLLVAFCVWLVWRGGPAGRGVVPGLLAGSASVFLLFLVRSGTVCTGPLLCFFVAAGGGLASALAISGVGARLGLPRAQLVTAFAVAAVTGLLGCSAFGLGGMVGLAVGSLLGATPGYFLAPRPSE